MSTDFRLRRLIPAADLFGGRLEKHGVREKIVEEQDVHEWAAASGFKLPPGAGGKIPGTTEHCRCLTDGTNCIWVDISERGFVAMLTRYGDNDPNEILGAIDKEFDADIIDEEHPEFWKDYEGEVVAIDISEFEVIKAETKH